MIICPMAFLFYALLGGRYYTHINFLNYTLLPLKEQKRKPLPRSQETSWMEFVSIHSSCEWDNAGSETTGSPHLSYLPGTPLCGGEAALNSTANSPCIGTEYPVKYTRPTCSVEQLLTQRLAGLSICIFKSLSRLLTEHKFR